MSPVHGVGGVIGSASYRRICIHDARRAGFSVAASIGSQVGSQLIGVALVAGWCALVTWLLLKLIDMSLGLRVTDEEENEGLDLASHGERGYSP